MAAGGYTSDFSASISGGKLHVFSQTTTPDNCFGICQGGGAFSSSDTYWFDTFTFSPGTYAVDLFLDGTVSYLGSFVHGGASSPGMAFFENGTVIPGIQYTGQVGATLLPGDHTTVNLSFGSTTSITLGELILVRNSISCCGSSGGTTGGSETLDLSNTGYFTVTPQDGGSYSTASGFSYSTVPEPGSLLLLPGAIGLLWRIYRRDMSRR